MISELKPGERIAEFYLGADDWLVLTSDAAMTRDQYEAAAKYWKQVVEQPGRKAVVLQAGLRLQVVHVGGAVEAWQD